MNNLSVDLRYAARRLGNAPGFTFAVLTMLALGIALSVVMYCAVNGVLLRGLPFPNGDRIVMVSADNPTQDVPYAQLTTAEAQQLASGTTGFDALGFFQWSGVTVLDGGHPREIPALLVGAGFFETLGMKPLLGRSLSADDIRTGRPLAVISHAEWQRAFGGNPHVIGQRLDLIGDAPLEIIGVMPPEIAVFAGQAGVWAPLRDPVLPQDAARRLDQRILQVIARLQDGVSLQQADAALDAQSAALRQAHGIGDGAAQWRLRAQPLLDVLVGDARGSLWSALALALMVLLIACANVAILVDARQTARRRELAVMQAIGASAPRLRRALMLELLIVTFAAVAIGIALAQGGIDLLRDLAQGSVPNVDGISMDWRVFGFAVLIGLAAPFAAVVNRSLQVRADPSEAIRAGAHGVVGARTSNRLLPALAMALSTVSLVVALGLGIGLWQLQRVDPGFATAQVHALQLFRESLNTDSGAAGPGEWAQFAGQVQDQLAALPGARAVALTTAAPLSRIGAQTVDVQAIGIDDAQPVQVSVRRVSAEYRDLLGVRLLAGRDFDPNDRAGTESVAIINRTLARRLFGETSPLDRSISLPLSRTGRATCRVVGVVDDIRNDGLRTPSTPEVLVSFAQHARVAMTFLVRGDATFGNADALMAQALWRVDPRQSITRQFALDDDLAEETRPARFFARVVAFFAFAALLLAVIGAYAVASLAQKRRVSEFGLRLAVGASPRALALAVLRDSVIASVAGVAIGLLVAALALRLLDDGEVGIGPVTAQPLVIGLSIGMMTLAAVIAALLPALRAARTSPMLALREE